jgi:uncharacterized protein YaiI (UPF0178 family)
MRDRIKVTPTERHLAAEVRIMSLEETARQFTRTQDAEWFHEDLEKYRQSLLEL